MLYSNMKPLTKSLQKEVKVWVEVTMFRVHARNPGTIVLHPKVGGLIVGAQNRPMTVSLGKTYRIQESSIINSHVFSPSVVT